MIRGKMSIKIEWFTDSLTHPLFLLHLKWGFQFWDLSQSETINISCCLLVAYVQKYVKLFLYSVLDMKCFIFFKMVQIFLSQLWPTAFNFCLLFSFLTHSVYHTLWMQHVTEIRHFNRPCFIFVLNRAESYFLFRLF